MRVNLCEQAAYMGNLVPINRKIGTHHAVFAGQRTESDWLFAAITVLIVLQPEDGGDGGCVQKTEAESSGTLCCAFNTLLPSHGEIAQQPCTNYVIITCALSILVDNLAVAIANFSRSLRVPHSAGQHCLNRIYQPHKIRVGVGNLNLRHFDIGADAFWDCTNLQRGG